MSSNPEKLERLKQPKSMSMYASQGDMISDLLIDRSLASAEIDRLKRENEELQKLADRLKLEAQGHAMEARTANSTIYEIYQIVTGAKGEPGNWSGAEPVRKFVTEMQAALLPFSKAAEIKLCGEWRDDERFAQTDVGFYLTFGDLRRARAAIASTGGEHHGN
ncbi:hypothetical protein [Agrobacterium larrymoorei]|uniref:hypothetical protein n=1 Tax=Agrobacterium larrymoorei TaxID=160699 RepID=UPI0030BD675B